MRTYKPLPPLGQLQGLAKQLIFPASRNEIMEEIEEMGSDERVIDFVGLFDADTEFESRSDFLTQCEELRFLIHEERDARREYLRSPQG